MKFSGRADRRRRGARVPSAERIKLGNFPTRINRLPDLGSELGVDLWIKHEFEADAFGAGNKVRKLEYLIPEILSNKCQGLVVDGTTQSNCAMALALYAPRFGLSVHLVLYGSTAPEGNFADILRSGASLTLLPAWSPTGIQAAENRIVAEALLHGQKLYVVPTGATNATTALAGVDLAVELAQQEDEEVKGRFDFVIFPTASGGTQAGLEMGRALLARPWNLIGIGVANDAGFFREVAATIAKEPFYAKDLDASFDPAKVQTHMGALGDLYGIPLPGAFSDIANLRTQFGLVLDSVYMHKTMVGLRQLILTDKIPAGSRVVLIHTGGLNERFRRVEEQAQPG